MNVFRRIFGRELSPAWEFAPGGAIWKLQITRSGILFGEARDIEAKQLSLFALSLPEGAPLFSGRSLDEPWWIALETVLDETAIMHRYPRPDLPNALGVTALDCRTGRILWEDPTLRILCGNGSTALAQRGNSPELDNLLFIRPDTGELVEELGNNTERAQEFAATCEDAERWIGWVYGEPVEPSHPDYDEINRLIADYQADRRGAPHAARYGSYTVVSLHRRSADAGATPEADPVDNVLLLFREGRRVYERVTTKNAPGPGDDVFFIRNGLLIFIGDRERLIAIDLKEETE